MPLRPLALVLALGLLLPPTLLAAPAAPAPPPALAGPLQAALGLDAAPLDAPPRTLREAVQAWDARLGIARDARSLDVLDVLAPDLAAPVAGLLGALLAADELRARATQGLTVEDILFATEHPSDPRAHALAARVDHDLMRRAALGLALAVEQALPELQAYAAALPAEPRLVNGPPTVNLPPVLVMDPAVGNTLYTKDAVLALDVGGHDVYDMNAGGGLIGIGLIDTDPTSCQLFVGGVGVGCEHHDAAVTITAALALDLTGDDVYGVYEPPRPGGRDARCTTNPIVREIVLQGSASGGVGMLLDATGADQYHGKTLAQGNGHVAGVGVFFDLTGDDQYHVIREGPGSAALGAVGFFQDAAGNDLYNYRSPAGGIWNADRGFCDASTRFGLAGAIIAGEAHFQDLLGDDTYRIASQAFGSVDATSVVQFLDASGTDDYGGFPGRGNGQQVTTAGGRGVFVDV